MRWVASLVAETHPHPDPRRRRSCTRATPRTRPGRAGCGCCTRRNPIAFLVEQAGGVASTGRGRCWSVVPTGLHQRVAVDLRLARRGRAHRALPPRARATTTFDRRCSTRARCSAPSGRWRYAMSVKHPVIAITGSSGAGTTSVTRTFQQIFRREGIAAAIVEGDSFHRYDRERDEARDGRAAGRRQPRTSATSARRRTAARSSGAVRDYGETGTGRVRRYLHDDEEAAPYGQHAGHIHAWEDIPPGTDLLFYEGLHGASSPRRRRRAARRPAHRRRADHQPGVDPEAAPRQGPSAATPTRRSIDTILRRMPDYVNYICPQFSPTHVNSSGCPTVDTSNPFIARDHPDRRRELRWSSASPTRRASTSPTCCRCCTTRSCPGRT